MTVVCADDPGGIMARRLLVASILIPFILGWLRTLGERAQLFDVAFGRPALVLSLIVSFSTLIWWNARAMSEISRQRLQAEAQREQVRDDLKIQHERSIEILESISDAFYAVDAGLRFTYVNRKTEELWRCKRDELLGKHFWTEFPQIVGTQAYHMHLQVMKERKPVRYETVSPLFGRWVDVSLYPEANGGLSCYFRDISERKQSEEALRESEERYRAIFDQATSGIIRTDLTGRILLVNRKFSEMVGYSPEELYTMRMQDITYKEDLASNLTPFSRAVAGGPNYVIEKRYVCKDKSIVWVSLSVTAVKDASGTPHSMLAVVSDISERKKGEQELRKAKEEAERASAAKSDFLATLSHELRTPLTPVLLTVSLMESHPALPEDLRNDVMTIRRNVELESRLISDLLDLTRIERGKLQLEMREVDLHVIIRSAIDICQREASARLVLDLKATRNMVRGDNTRLQQIFWNLINNAQKFTPPDGLITVRSGDLPGDRIFVEVTDTGSGIDAEVLPRLFNAFEQGEARAVRQQAGLGLGLAISQKIAEAHDGTISASSEGKGRGATFRIELPLIDVLMPKEAVPRVKQDALAAKRELAVLLVEDHEPTLNIMTKLLRKLGHRVSGATSVATATAAARQDSYDIIISDLGLPDGSGLDVIRELREQYSGRAIALTGYGMESDIIASRAAGFAEHLTKPVDLAVLQAAINRVAASNLEKTKAE